MRCVSDGLAYCVDAAPYRTIGAIRSGVGPFSSPRVSLEAVGLLDGYAAQAAAQSPQQQQQQQSAS